MATDNGQLFLYVSLCYNFIKIGDMMSAIVREYSDLDFLQANNLIKEAFGYEKKKVYDDNVYEFVCVLDEVIVGYFNMTIIQDVIKGIKISHIDYVCISEKYRGRGLGKMMMEFAIEFASNKGISRIELTSSSKRVAAHKLYLSLGFEVRDSSVFRKELL